MSSTPGSGHQNPQVHRRGFTDLHPKDQTIKLNRKARIESNWACEIQHCLPLHIRPRMELKKGAKARVGDLGVSEEIWWNWSVEVLRSLEELSTMTAGRIEFAQELLQIEVVQRQSNPKHPQRKLVEVLLGDIQRVIDGMRRNQLKHNVLSQRDEHEKNIAELDNENNYDDYDHFEDEELQDANDAHTDEHDEDAMVADDYPDNEEPGVSPSRRPFDPEERATPTLRRSSRNHAHGSKNPANLDVKIIEIRARAIRLKSQAARLEAAAVELEADAAELRSEME